MAEETKYQAVETAEVMLGEGMNSAAKNGCSEEMLGTAHSAEYSFTSSAAGADPAKVTKCQSPEERFERLRELASEYLEEKDLDFLERAFNYANEAHKGPCRKSGEPYITHPIEVAIILTDLHMDVETLTAAILHDTVEDTDATFEEVAKVFNESVAQLVEGVTKITRIEVETLTDQQAQTIRKMLVAMNKDIRVIVIKLADRLHNMRTLSALREDRRIFKSRETLEIYAPIAHRLGINSMKWELEDLAFFYLEPVKFKQVSRLVAESRQEREKYLACVMKELQEEMDYLGIECQMMGRPKHLYSIYQKMVTGGKDFSEIYDLIAVRIIVNSINECYSALGAVHYLWHPMPGRFKDYIAMPKYNMYQSLHTTVIGPAARPLEVQIRTEEMHEMSEYGVAAHWRYKEGGGGKKDAAFDQTLAWLRQMVDWQDETRDSREFLKTLKVDLADSEVYVFTPKGEVVSLRAGSTPVDFAYAIHTEVGNHCVGAKVNAAIVPLSYELKMGDRVEILTQKSAAPNRNWITMVKTPSARSKIRSYFSKASRSDDLQLGHDKLVREMRKNGMGINNAPGQRALREVAEHLGFKDVDEMLIGIGCDRESVQHVANRMIKLMVDREAEAEAEAQRSYSMGINTGRAIPLLTNVKHPSKRETHSSSGIVVKGVEGVLVRLANCCNPVPGDDIMGFVTRGRGVSVHRSDCPNAQSLQSQKERIIDVSWDANPKGDTTYKAEVVIEAVDRMNLLRDVIAVLSEEGANVLSSSSRVSPRDNMAVFRFLFQVSDVGAINSIIRKAAAVHGVFDVHRTMPGEDPAADARKAMKKGSIK